ncbi:cadherin domain-containing protein, partial [Porticoccaceae bacterium]|nr:cadherin domain-containing protein [Porticoccaceae bacterium]
MINTNMMKYSLLSFAIIFFGSSTAVADSDLSNTTTSEANQQIISVSQSSVGSVGGSVQIDITYSTSNLDNTTTGLGFRLHYNSNLMEISAVNYLLQKDLLVDVTGPLEDNQDHDNDASTDQYYSVGWASLNGDWPNEALPANVLSLQITIDSEIEIDQIDSTPINFSATALASGYQFLPQNYNLELTDSTWDFDGSCDADALTDGLILLRAGFDLRGEYLISNVMHPDATLTASEVEARIEKAVSITDIDSNGGFDALTDGLLLLRYLFDFRDQNLVSDVLSQTATRTSGDAIAQYIEQYMPNCINDTTPPVIISADAAIAIDENSGAGQLVYTAMAIDTDFNGAEYITFNLINEDLGFSIDNATGDVTTNADFAADYEDIESQSFTVVATDAAGNASEQVVNVAINNLDEVAPSITSGDTATAVDENSGADQVVYTATADDSADTSDGVTFSLADEGLGFSIDTATGIVTTNADFAVDYENAQSQSFTVVATDTAGNASEQVVSVAINNLDEVPPLFMSDETAIAVNENSGTGQVIYSAKASDADFNGTEYIIFSLADESLGFSIDAATGVVTTNDDFAADYENAQSQSFTVVATDAAGNASEQVVSVAINNLDEIAPSITSGDTGTAVDENSGAGQVVYTATATDDADTSDGFSFSLADESLGFSIDEDGVVTTNDDFTADYESAQSQSITLVATDAAGNASEQVVNVAINNLDEIAPSITSGDTATAIDENSGTGQIIYTVTASDTDFNGVVDITFSLADESLGFSIDGDGVVTTNDDFAANYESAQSQSFTVVATDATGNASEQVVSVAINNLDEVAPSIISGDTATAVNENSGADQVVYTATASDTDFNGLEDITFSLSDSSDPALSIDSTTGAVTLSTDPDHETQSQYSFTVIASDGVNADVEQLVTLDINNLDEVAPTITSDATATSIDENSGAGQVIYAAMADDSSDDVSDTPITFSLADESVGFSIDASTGVVTTNVDFAADYEDAQSQSFTVIATDVAGNAADNAGQVVSVAINNLDEVAPSITSGDTATAIDENSGEGQVVYTATATDDADISAGVTFSLTDSDPALYINSLTGAVTLATDPDYETQSQYSFTVVASDGVNEAVEQSVTLDINNLDEMPPSITSAATATAIDENSGSGQPVYTVTAEDSAEDVYSAQISFNLSSDSDLALSIDPATGEVVLADDPDYETQNQYNFAVIATDAAGNQSDAQSVTLEINDLNDTGPIITSGDTATAIDENSGSTQLIYTATANDPSDTELPVSLVTIPELAEATQHVYVSLSTKSEDGTQETIVISYNADDSTTTGLGIRVYFDSSAININEVSNILPNDLIASTSYADDDSDLDSDPSTDQYITWAWASMSGTWPGTEGPVDLATITFDINVNATGISAINFTASSSMLGFDFAGQTHNLAITNPPMTFSLSVDSDPAISIDSSTGDVFLNNDPDYEAQGQYNFAVIATNALGVESEAQPVILDINNLDEISPIFISASAAAIDENFGSNKVVYTAIADDSEDISGGVTFGLSGADETYFTIDESSGKVRLIDNPDYEAQNQYYFTVIADDGVNASVEQQVMLEINNLDDSAPIFNPYDSVNWIDENSGPNQFVFQVEAIDPDFNNNDYLIYSLSGTDAFTLSIDPFVGYVSLIPSPDYESQTEYSFTAIAIDGAGNTSESLPYTLYINNLDEVAPSITSGDTAVAIDENTGAGQVVYTATADDSLDISAGVTFSLTGDSDPALSIDPSTGEVILTIEPDHEAQSSYSFAVIATDAAGNESEAQSVTLDINNLDEIAPALTSGATATAINENTGASQVIYTATADDSADISAGVTFSLTGESDPALSIDSLTGEVMLTTDPDYETQSQYSFAVIATDAADNESDAQLVTLDINNIDDTAPIITSGNTAFGIFDNTGASQIVYRATAVDSDNIGGATFSLVVGSDIRVDIDPSTGEVTLNFDGHSQSVVIATDTFSVIATDAAGNESAAKSVTLDILDNSTSDTNILLDMTAPFSSEPNTEIPPTIITSETGDTVYNIPAIHFANEQNPGAYGGFAHNTLTSGLKLYNWEGAEAGQAYLDAVVADAAASVALYAAEDALDLDPENEDREAAWVAAATEAKTAAQNLRDTNYYSNTLTFGGGGYIYFKGSVPSGGEASLIFMIFHYQVDPITGDFVTTLDENGNPPFVLVDNQSFTTDPITIKGSEESYYAVKIDSTGKQGNMITMFFSPPDTDVMISDVRVITTPARDEMVRGPYFFNNVFSVGPVGDDPATEEIETYMPLGIDGNLLGYDNALPSIEITNEGTTFMVPSAYFEDPDADGEVDNPGAFSGFGLDSDAIPDLNSRPLTFGEGGKITFMGSVESGEADVRFRLERIGSEFSLETEPSCTMQTTIIGSGLTEYTVFVPPQAKRTFEYMVMYIDTPDTEVTLSNVLIETSPVDPAAVPVDCGSDAALYGDKELDMTAPYGDATIDVGTDDQGNSIALFRVDSAGADNFAGYAVNNGDDPSPLVSNPAAFGAGGAITFTASIPALQQITDTEGELVDLPNPAASVDLRFKFERESSAEPDNCITEPSFTTEVITVSGAEQEYTIDIPIPIPNEYGEGGSFNTYQSFIMELLTADTQVQISNITLSTTPPTRGIYARPPTCF